MSELTTAWVQLEAKAQVGSVLDQVRLFGDQPLDLFAIYAPAEREVGIQLVVDAAAIPALGTFPSPGTFRTSTTRVAKRTRISVLLTRDDFRPVFAEMCVDLLAVCLRAGGEQEAARALHRRLTTWQELFLGRGPLPLTEAEQLGLYGELTFLMGLLDENVDGRSAVECWYGPRRDPHDFHRGRIHVEVKTTEATSMSVSIASLDQLDHAGLDRLFLWHVQLAVTTEGGRTLPMLVDGIRGRLAGTALDLFNELLVRARYLDTHRAFYDAVPLVKIGERAFLVDSSFPALRRDNVPVAVRNAKYECDLAKVPMNCLISSGDALNEFISGVEVGR